MARNPLTAVPATRSSLPLLKIRRRLVVGVLGVAVLSGFASTGAWLLTDTTPPAAVVLPSAPAVALAETVARDFLAGRKSAVPAVHDVTSDFTPLATGPDAPKPMTVQALTFSGSQPWKLGDGSSAALVTEQETFTALVDGQLYDITVPMVQSGKSWYLGAAPSIAPAATGTDQSGESIDYSKLYPSLGGGTSDLPNDGYRTQIAKWAGIYAKAGKADGDLLAITDDVSPENHTYSGLGGWSVVGEPTIGSVVKVSTPYPGFIVRVGLVLRSPAANGPTLSTDYDLYLRSDRNPTQPPVVAWGAAGSYKSLQPYINADPR